MRLFTRIAPAAILFAALLASSAQAADPPSVVAQGPPDPAGPECRAKVQYFVNPDNYYPPSAKPRRPTDGIEAGFFAVVSLGRLLGTSLKPF